MKKNAVFRIVLITMGVALLIDAVILTASFRSNFGVVPQSIIAAVLIFCGALFPQLKGIKWLRCLLAAGFSVLAVCCIALAAYGSADNAQYDENIVIVLGSGVRGDELTPNSVKRLDKAVEYYHNNPSAVFIVSGGQGAGESVTEASAMEKYLLKSGLPSEQIIKEERSTSTYENFAHSLKLSDGLAAGSRAVFITSRFHIFRAERLARLLGMNPRHIGSGIVWYTVPMNYLRELAAIAKFLVLRR